MEATKQVEPRAHSLAWSLIDDARVETDDDGCFRIAIPHSKAVPYLTFSNYLSVADADAMAVKADLFVTHFAKHAKQDESLKDFMQVERATKYEAFLLGHLCKEEGFGVYEFLLIAKEAPLLFKHIRVAVNEACAGNDAVLFNEEVARAKKD